MPRAKRKTKPPIRLAWAGDAREAIRKLEPADRLLAAGVAFMRMMAADNDGRNSFESQETVGSYLGLYRKTVARGDRLLVELGVLEPEGHTWPRKHGYQLSVGHLERPTGEDSLLVIQKHQQQPSPVGAPVGHPVGHPEAPLLPTPDLREGVRKLETDGSLTVAAVPNQNGNLNEGEVERLKSVIELLAPNWTGFDPNAVNWTNSDLHTEWTLIPEQAFTWDWEHRFSIFLGQPREVRNETGWLITRLRWIRANKLSELGGKGWLPPPRVRLDAETECCYCDEPGADCYYIGEPHHLACALKFWVEEKKLHEEMLAEEAER